ncbi:MAG: Gfo/Idh/MocA family oxidoreductase [Clostridia bacterium]|nr:Gfo/Idh/MocA family oxidoreductase [Clostridia bacterium]
MKTVICGLWHVHAEQYYKTAAEHTEVLGVWEQNEAWRKAFCEKYGLKEFKSLDELLASGADAAIVCTSSDTHAEVMVKLADAKMDIFTEKVLALTTAECEAVEEAVKRNGVKFVISYPHKYGAMAQTVKSVVDSGELGKINYFRFRNVHDGSTGNWLPPHFYNAKECGGGAMIDLGAHGMYLADWILGMPVAASSTFTLACENPETAKKNVDQVEDNAVTVLQYANGAIAINETGFVSHGYPITIEVGGELGWVRSTGKTAEKRTKETKAVVEVPMVEGLPSPLKQFCTGNILPGCGIEEAKNLTKLMEMAYRK